MLSTKANGLLNREMASEFKIGQMALAIRDNGNKVHHTVEERLIIQTEIVMKGNGLMGKQVGLEYTRIMLELFMRVSGQKICNKGGDTNSGTIKAATKDNIEKVKNKVSEFIAGLMEAITKGSGKTTLLTEKDNMCGKVVESTKGIGKMGKCMALVSIAGRMGGNTLDNILKIRSTEGVNISGRTDDAFKVLGRWEKEKGRGN